MDRKTSSAWVIIHCFPGALIGSWVEAEWAELEPELSKWWLSPAVPQCLLDSSPLPTHTHTAPVKL